MKNILFILSLILMMFFFIILMKSNFFLMINLLNIMGLNFYFVFKLIEMLFVLVVLMISFIVYFYSKIYFSWKMNFSFKINLFLFIISMILLLISESVIMIMISWDILGISSFYLIMFYNNMESSISSLITFFFNRMGDSMLMLFMFFMLMNKMNMYLININLYLFLFLLLSSISKSAQIPFGVWLPMAMAAPTPISSLVHSSTLVTAGMFLMLKMNYMFFMKEIQMFMLMVGLITFMLTGIFSMMILDLKKAIAFSTFSQLGFMLISLSMGKIMILFLHLVSHAIFKSLLFMNLGLFMLNNFSIQDQRILNTKSMNNLIFLPFFISCFSLMGLVLSVGFMSKDLILINMFLNTKKLIILILFYIGCLFTISYSLKFLMIFMEKNLLNMKVMKNMILSFYFIKLLLLSIFCLSMMMFFMEFSMINTENYLNSNLKMTFYIMLFISLLLNKIVFNMKIKLMFSYSSMLNIFYLMNNMLKTMMKMFFNKIYNLMFIEEYWQVTMLIKMMNYKTSTNLINSTFKLNMSMLLFLLLFLSISMF